MQGNNGKRIRGSYARGFAALWAILAMALALSARPAAAAPFAYVTNSSSGFVSVIDTATNMVVTTVTVPFGANGVAVTPDGTHAYVADDNFFSGGTVAVIATASNTVATTVTVGSNPEGVAITPDGTHVYVTNLGTSPLYLGTVSVIDTATNTVVATINVGTRPVGVAITPDGQHAYVASNNPAGTVSVIATASNTVVGSPIPVGQYPNGVAVTPDGTHAYVANNLDSSVSVIDTSTNTVVATVGVGTNPQGVAVTPDGTHVYVVNNVGYVSVIDTATNMVVGTPITVGSLAAAVAFTPDGTRAYVANAGGTTVSVIATSTMTVVDTIPVGFDPEGVGIIPGFPFAAFSATPKIQFGTTPNTDSFEILTSFTLGSASNGINPPAEPVTLQIGTFSTTIPAGSFTGTSTSSAFGPFFFTGTNEGVPMHAVIAPTGAKRFSFQAAGQNASLTGTVNPVPVTLTIGNNSGTTSVTATIAPTLAVAH